MTNIFTYELFHFPMLLFTKEGKGTKSSLYAVFTRNKTVAVTGHIISFVINDFLQRADIRIEQVVRLF